VASLEFLIEKNDLSSFIIGSHSKKRPHNLVFGRAFDHRVLEMVEVGVTNLKEMTSFHGEKPMIGSKPLLLCEGDFEAVFELRRFKNMLIDQFRGQLATNVNLAGIDHVIVLTAIDKQTVLFRHYGITLKKSGSRLPRVELHEVFLYYYYYYFN
jgi:ribosome production factor 2